MKPGIAIRSSRCSSSYQRLKSSSCAGSMSVIISNSPFGICVSLSPLELGLALLDEGALRLFRVIGLRQRDRHGLLEAVAVASGHLGDRVERALDLTHRDRALRRNLAR